MTQRSHYGKVAKVSLLWSIVREGTASVLAIGSAVILARLLSPEEFGVAAVAYFFVNLGSRLTQFGFNASLVRLKNLRPEHASSVFVVNLATGIAAWTAVTVSAPALGAFFQSEAAGTLLPVAGLSFVIAALGTVPAALLSRDMRYRETAIAAWLGGLIGAVVAVSLARLGFSVWSLLYGQLAGQLADALARIHLSGWRLSVRFSRPAIKELFSFGSGIYIRSLLEYAAQNLDTLIVGRVLGMGPLGFYDKAVSTMARTSGKLNLAGPTVSFRIFSIIHEEPERFRRAYRKVVLSATMVAYPVLTGMILVGPELMVVLFGDNWLPSTVPFQILCGAAMFKVLNTYASSASQAKGVIWSEVCRQAIFTGILVIAVLALAGWGITGAATGVLCATVAMTLSLQAMVRRATALSWRDMLEPLAPALTCSIGLVPVVWATQLLARTAVPASPAWASLVWSTLTGGLYYLGFLYFSPFGQVRALLVEFTHDLSPSIVRRLPLPWWNDARAL